MSDETNTQMSSLIWDGVVERMTRELIILLKFAPDELISLFKLQNSFNTLVINAAPSSTFNLYHVTRSKYDPLVTLPEAESCG